MKLSRLVLIVSGLQLLVFFDLVISFTTSAQNTVWSLYSADDLRLIRMADEAVHEGAKSPLKALGVADAVQLADLKTAAGERMSKVIQRYDDGLPWIERLQAPLLVAMTALLALGYVGVALLERTERKGKQFAS